MFVVLRLRDAKYWAGKGWVKAWEEARHYPPSPEDGIGQATAERERLESEGEECVVLHLSGDCSRSRPRPTARSAAVGV